MALANLTALLGVLLRRLLKNRFFALKDEHRLAWNHAVDAVLRGESLPARKPSLRRPWDRDAAEEVLLERFVGTTPERRRVLQDLFRGWGLYDYRVQQLLWGNPWQQAQSALVLAQMQCFDALRIITTLLDDRRADVRLAGVNALAILGRPEGLEAIIGLLSRGDEHQGRPIMEALLRCARLAPNRLLPHLHEGASPIRVAMAAALAELARKEELPGLLPAVRDSEPEVRAKVARALGRTGDPAALEGLARLAGDPVWYVRLQAMAALGRIGSPDAEPLLWRGIEDPDARVRSKATLALHEYLRNPTELLTRLQPRRGDPTALRALADELSYEGIIWQALDQVRSSLLPVSEESRRLVCKVLEAGFFKTILYAVETHTDLLVRQELLGLVEKCAGPDVRAPLAALQQAPVLDAESRRRLNEILARQRERA